ncbi:MAG TPA: aromatic ring-hydroxylating dioxygenase subunit alpha [Xanthobacteraceae bacterium]|nr:aromatic ring-hydroxylating dioxygenase subunit alpha [Xanthobacteraceae bacterium]
MQQGDMTPVAWPSDSLTRVPFGLYCNRDQYALEQERIFNGPTWNYLCLAAELPRPGDYLVSGVGEASVIVARAPAGELNAFVNRCAHRGSLLCLKRRGHAENITCVYHGWSYDLAGQLTGVSFERGVKRQGGMPAEFKRSEHNLRRLRIAEFCGLVFGSFDDGASELESYLGPDIAARIRRVLTKPVKVLGRTTQMLPNNWKLYLENVKDSYHASILHLFFTTFEINRLTQKGAIIIDDSGGHHVSYSVADQAADNSAYRQQALRSNKDGYRLEDSSVVEAVDEFGDGITMQILTVFPGFVLQQHLNSIAVRQLLPRGVDRSELVWTILGFEDDDHVMTERRLKQANLVGPAGYISMEDGAVGGFVQRAVRGLEEDSGVLMMGGSDARSQEFRTTEASVRGFWKKYRSLMGA